MANEGGIRCNERVGAKGLAMTTVGRTAGYLDGRARPEERGGELVDGAVLGPCVPEALCFPGRARLRCRRERALHHGCPDDMRRVVRFARGCVHVVCVREQVYLTATAALVSRPAPVRVGSPWGRSLSRNDALWRRGIACVSTAATSPHQGTAGRARAVGSVARVCRQLTPRAALKRTPHPERALLRGRNGCTSPAPRSGQVAAGPGPPTAVGGHALPAHPARGPLR